MTKSTLKLIGEDGNAFSILGKACREARRAGWSSEKIEKFQKDATSGNYDNLLRVVMEYFEVI